MGSLMGGSIFLFLIAIAADWCGSHYFYQLRPEYFAPSTPRGWFRTTKHPSTFVVEGSGFYPGNSRVASRRARNCLILSQSMVIDIDGNKVYSPLFGSFP